MSNYSNIKGIRKQSFFKKLKGKDEILGVDPSIINLHNHNKCSYNLVNIIDKVNTKEELHNMLMRKMAYNLYYEEKNEYNTDLSLLIGLNFGVYKLYSNGELIRPRLKEKILKSNPNVDDTKYIIDNFNYDICLCVSSNYGFDKDKINNIIDNMMNLKEDDPSSVFDPIERFCAIDIAKIIMGLKVEYDGEKIDKNNIDISNKIRSGEFIKYFDSLNEREKSEHKTK